MNDLETTYPDDLFDLTDVERGVTVRDYYDDGVRVLIKANFGFCVYFGVPVGHPLAGFGYDSIPLDVHGGLTFSAEGDGKFYPEGFYWYGWDYSHAGDKSYYRTSMPEFDRNEKTWTLEEVIDEARQARYDFKRLMDLVEKVAAK